MMTLLQDFGTLVTDSPNIYISTILLTALLPTLYFLFSQHNSKLPPRYSLLAPLVKGEFDLKSEGPLAVLKKAYKEKGEIFRLRLFHQNVTALIGPDAHQIFFESKDSQLSQKECYGFTVPVFGPKIVYDAPLKEMLQQLKFVAKGLNYSGMSSHVLKIVSEAEEFFSRWPNEGEIDLMEQLSELIINTASRCLLGNEIRENVQKEFAIYYQQLSDGMSHLSFFWPNAPTQKHRERDHARNELSKIFGKVIKQRRKEPNQGSGLHDDFLQILIDAKYTDGRALEDEEITGLLLAALFAGQHTSNITSTWMGFMFGENPIWLKKVIQEQKAVMEKYENKITFESLAEMKILHSCMKETLRMYPPLIILMRKALEDMSYKGTLIPKGDIVCVSPAISHRLESIYTNPNEFDPSRFLERQEDKDKYSFLAFGGGRHSCLGERFAFLQVKTIWSLMSRKFEFEMVQKTPEIDYSALVCGPKMPCRMRFRRKPDPYA